MNPSWVIALLGMSISFGLIGIILNSVFLFIKFLIRFLPSSGSREHTEYINIPFISIILEPEINNLSCSLFNNFILLLKASSLLLSLQGMSGFFLIVPVEEQGASIKTASASVFGFQLFASLFTILAFNPSLLRLFESILVLFRFFSTAVTSTP